MAEQKVVRFDWAMKNMLRNKANYDIIEGFLCALLEDDNITVVEILEGEGNMEFENDKFNRVDVLVKDSLNRNIIIEIQNTRETDYLYRLVYGTSKNITESIQSGDAYHKINKVISISILYFNLGIGDDYLYYGQTEFVGLNTSERINKDSDKVQHLIPKHAKYNQIEIFPEYYLIQVNKYQNIVKKAIDEWIYWFKNERVKEDSHSKNIEKVSQKLDVLKMSPEERKKYNNYLEKLASEHDMVETSKREGIEETEAKLLPKIEAEREKAKAEREKAKAEREKVKAEREKLKRTIRNMKAKGMDNKTIAEITGLPENEIEKM